METLAANLRYALRRILKSPLHSGIVLLCLALGIGANTAIFSVVNSLLLQPLPVEDAEELVFTLDLREEDDPFESSIFDYLEFKKETRIFEAVGLTSRRSFDILGDGEPERVEGAAVSGDYFSTLGVGADLGRLFLVEEYRPDGPAVALVGHALWKRRFGGDQEALGRSIRLGDRTVTIVGVLPAGFDLPLGTELWLPHQVSYQSLAPPAKDDHNYLVIARLQDGISLTEANAAAAGIARQLARAYPELRNGWGIKLITLRQQLMGDVRGEVRPTLSLVLLVVGFLLLIACANVASLLLVRSLERSQEVALRLALGASRRSLVGQLLTESVVLSLLGGALGLLLAYFLTPPLMSLNPVNAYALKGLFYSVPLDLKVLVYTLLLAIVTGILFGLVPALRAGREDLVGELKEGAKGSGSSRHNRFLLDALVVGEIAVAATLLVGAGLMARSFQRMQNVDLGFQPASVLTVDLYLTQEKYRDQAQRLAFVQDLLEQVRLLPGTVSAGVATNTPLAQEPFDFSYTVEGAPPLQENRVPFASHRVVTPDYLETLGMRLLQGRLLNERDREGAVQAMVVTEAFAREAFGGLDEVIGRRVRLGYPPREELDPFEVVGLVADVKEDRFNFRIDRPVWYISYLQLPSRLPISLAVKTSGDPVQLISDVRRTILAIDPNQPVARTATMEEAVSYFLNPARFSAVLVGLFALLGLLLAAIGLYGVMTYSVGQRRQEMGVRIAMGAKSEDLLRLILGRGLVLTLTGLGIGLVASLLLSRWLSSLLFQVGTTDLPTFATISVILVATALLASFLPAHRTTRVDPVTVLRAE